MRRSRQFAGNCIVCPALRVTAGNFPRLSRWIPPASYLLTAGLVLAFLIAGLSGQAARAAITIENGTATAVTCRLAAGAASAARDLSIAPGAAKSLDTTSAVDCQFQSGGRATRYSLQPGRQYRFSLSSAGQLELRALAANAAKTPAAAKRPANNPPAASARPPIAGDHRQGTKQSAPAVTQKKWPQVRVVKVIVAGGKEYRAFYRDWHQRAGGIVADASRRFEQQFPIRFQVVGYRPWLYEKTPQTANDAFELLHKIDRGDADLVIGFTMVPFPGPRGEVRGVTQYYSPYVVIPDAWGTTGATTRLVHELCHVFGAFHVATLGSVMQLGFERTPRTFVFGPPTEQTVELGKDFDFAEGVDSLPPETQQKVRDIYRAHHHPIESIDDDPIVVGYRYLARRAGWEGDTERSARMQAIADKLVPTPAPAPGGLQVVGPQASD